MATLKEKITQDLVNSGFFQNDAESVFNRLVEDPAQISMRGRWNDQTTDYPAMILNISTLAVRSIALEYIKEKMPNAWFRPMFDDEMAKELGIL